MARREGPITRDRGKKPPYQLHGGIPWPELGDGTAYVLGCGVEWRVFQPERPTLGGMIQTVAWCHPDGTYMAGDEQQTTGTKTRPAVLRPGAWWATVSWDDRDTPNPPPARVPLADLAKA